MKYLKLYESFIEELEVIDFEKDSNDIELSDMTIDDILEYDKGSYIDSRNIVHIKNWNVY
jgi:hypothetical protein